MFAFPLETTVSNFSARIFSRGYAKTEMEFAGSFLDRVETNLKNGAKEDKLIFSAITVTPNFKLSNGTRTNDIKNYHASVSISYCDTDVDAVVKIADTAPELIEQGVSIFSPAPEYYYTKLEDLKISLIERAAANAKLRAQRLTSGTNSNLGKILSASQGIFQITRPLSNETSDWGIYDTSSREKDVRCVVTIEFAIDK